MNADVSPNMNTDISVNMTTNLNDIPWISIILLVLYKCKDEEDIAYIVTIKVDLNLVLWVV